MDTNRARCALPSLPSHHSACSPFFVPPACAQHLDGLSAVALKRSFDSIPSTIAGGRRRPSVPPCRRPIRASGARGGRRSPITTQNPPRGQRAIHGLHPISPSGSPLTAHPRRSDAVAAAGGDARARACRAQLTQGREASGRRRGARERGRGRRAGRCVAGHVSSIRLPRRV